MGMAGLHIVCTQESGPNEWGLNILTNIPLFSRNKNWNEITVKLSEIMQCLIFNIICLY